MSTEIMNVRVAELEKRFDHTIDRVSESQITPRSTPAIG
jgi:hypothetical protein